eukprot:TRINITY_DN74204_c0_g1_i1.p1 TRINITY_DN74204_c0_g1~~TRINITY_DN74204_c0_g1_i1.p1  ORF type:complete len:1119 (-),score=210.37 TRINITY_DN74204_c0_g1_i1:72-3335(-)
MPSGSAVASINQCRHFAATVLLFAFCEAMRLEDYEDYSDEAKASKSDLSALPVEVIDVKNGGVANRSGTLLRDWPPLSRSSSLGHQSSTRRSEAESDPSASRDMLLAAYAQRAYAAQADGYVPPGSGTVTALGRHVDPGADVGSAALPSWAQLPQKEADVSLASTRADAVQRVDQDSDASLAKLRSEFSQRGESDVGAASLAKLRSYYAQRVEAESDKLRAPHDPRQEASAESDKLRSAFEQRSRSSEADAEADKLFKLRSAIDQRVLSREADVGRGMSLAKLRSEHTQRAQADDPSLAKIRNAHTQDIDGAALTAIANLRSEYAQRDAEDKNEVERLRATVVSLEHKYSNLVRNLGADEVRRLSSEDPLHLSLDRSPYLAAGSAPPAALADSGTVSHKGRDEDSLEAGGFNGEDSSPSVSGGRDLPGSSSPPGSFADAATALNRRGRYEDSPDAVANGIAGRSLAAISRAHHRSGDEDASLAERGADGSSEEGGGSDARRFGSSAATAQGQYGPRSEIATSLGQSQRMASARQGSQAVSVADVGQRVYTVKRVSILGNISVRQPTTDKFGNAREWTRDACEALKATGKHAASVVGCYHVNDLKCGGKGEDKCLKSNGECYAGHINVPPGVKATLFHTKSNQGNACGRDKKIVGEVAMSGWTGFWDVAKEHKNRVCSFKFEALPGWGCHDSAAVATLETSETNYKENSAGRERAAQQDRAQDKEGSRSEGSDATSSSRRHASGDGGGHGSSGSADDRNDRAGGNAASGVAAVSTGVDDQRDTRASRMRRAIEQAEAAEAKSRVDMRDAAAARGRADLREVSLQEQQEGFARGAQSLMDARGSSEADERSRGVGSQNASRSHSRDKGKESEKSKEALKEIEKEKEWEKERDMQREKGKEKEKDSEKENDEGQEKGKNKEKGKSHYWRERQKHSDPRRRYRKDRGTDRNDDGSAHEGHQGKEDGKSSSKSQERATSVLETSATTSPSAPEGRHPGAIEDAEALVNKKVDELVKARMELRRSVLENSKDLDPDSVARLIHQDKYQARMLSSTTEEVHGIGGSSESRHRDKKPLVLDRHRSDMSGQARART